MQAYLNLILVLIVSCSFETKAGENEKGNVKTDYSINKNRDLKVVALEKEITKEYKEAPVQYLKEVINDEKFDNFLQEAIKNNQTKEIKQFMQIIDLQLASIENKENSEKNKSDFQESLKIVFEKAKTPAEVLELQFESVDSNKSIEDIIKEMKEELEIINLTEQLAKIKEQKQTK